MEATLRWGARAPHCSDFSCCGAWALECGLSSCGSRALGLWSTVAPTLVESSQPRDGTRVPHIARWTTMGAPTLIFETDASLNWRCYYGNQDLSGWVKQAQLLPCRDLRFRCFKQLSIVGELWDFELGQRELWKILFPRAGTFFTGNLAVQEQVYLTPLVLGILKKSNVTWIFRPLKEANQLRSPFWLGGENHQSDLPGTFSTHFTCRKLGTPPGEIKDEYLLESNNSGKIKFCIFQWKKWGDIFVFPPEISVSVDTTTSTIKSRYHFWYTYS